jgi:hypothetical protein
MAKWQEGKKDEEARWQNGKEISNPLAPLPFCHLPIVVLSRQNFSTLGSAAVNYFSP